MSPPPKGRVSEEDRPSRIKGKNAKPMVSDDHSLADYGLIQRNEKYLELLKKHHKPGTGELYIPGRIIG
jgi:hypothetical protein